MTDPDYISPDLRIALQSIYEEVMWLARRPNVTSGRARAWYTHIMAESVKKQLRQFTGSVSEQAVASPELDLRLEHYMRIQTTLTGLVTRHLQNTQPNPEEFIRTLFDYERVHIVTVGENYDAMRAKGDYTVAGIKLLPWASIPSDRRLVLWQRMLRGRVANAHDFLPIA